MGRHHNPYGSLGSDAGDTTSALGEYIFIESRYLPPVETPQFTEYNCDVLVVGCGFAGLHAAVTAKKRGASVIVMDKGMPGYSGLSPFAQGATYYLKNFDDREGCMLAAQRGGEYIANLDWFSLWLDESAQVVEENRAFGFMESYPTAKNSGYWDTWDPKGYRRENLGKARQEKWMDVLKQYDIPVVHHTMLVDVTTTDGRISGAVGFHVQSATPITFRCKAICLCTGTGSMKPTGYPTGEDTFDGEYICVNLGLTVVGKEFDDFHQTASFAPGNYFYNNTWEYSEGMGHSAIGATPDTIDDYVYKKTRSKLLYRINSVEEGLPPVDGSEWQSVFTGATTIIKNEFSETDPRKKSHKRSRERMRDIFGAAPGMNSQMSCGVFCGWDDTEGKTAVPGLYVAGNGIYGTQVNGAIFNVQTNHPGCCIMGNHAGAAASKYAAMTESVIQDSAQVQTIIDDLFAPMKRDKGIDPNLVTDKLRDIMVDAGVHIVKSEKSLTAALMQVELIRDKMLPLLIGRTGHDLRLCLEARHKTLSAEMKLKANIFRTESRGMHYREDYPYRDDDNWLCHVGVSKNDAGEIFCRKIDIPDAWKGDQSEPHEKRYVLLFPGEAKALGIPAEDVYKTAAPKGGKP